MSASLALVESPCVRICRLTPDGGTCVGCGRALDEIAGWAALAADERRHLTTLLPARLLRLAQGDE